MVTESINEDTQQQEFVATYTFPEGLDWAELERMLREDGFRIPMQHLQGSSGMYFQGLQDAFMASGFYLRDVKTVPLGVGVRVELRFRATSRIRRIATSNNSENYRAFVEQMQRELFHGMGIPEHMGGGPLYGRHSPVFTDTPVITPSPAPKPKTISPFSIGLGQRSIEV